MSGARMANLLLGVWLFISAFVWPHTPASMVNTFVVGLAIAAVAAWGATVPRLRWMNTALAVWLIVSTMWLYRPGQAAAWNNLIASLIVFAISLVPTKRGLRPVP